MASCPETTRNVGVAVMFVGTIMGGAGLAAGSVSVAIAVAIAGAVTLAVGAVITASGNSWVSREWASLAARRAQVQELESKIDSVLSKKPVFHKMSDQWGGHANPVMCQLWNCQGAQLGLIGL